MGCSNPEWQQDALPGFLRSSRGYFFPPKCLGAGLGGFREEPSLSTFAIPVTNLVVSDNKHPEAAFRDVGIGEGPKGTRWAEPWLPNARVAPWQGDSSSPSHTGTEQGHPQAVPTARDEGDSSPAASLSSLLDSNCDTYWEGVIKKNNPTTKATELRRAGGRI